MWIKRNSLEGTTIFKKENVQKIDIFNSAICLNGLIMTSNMKQRRNKNVGKN